MNWMPRSGMVSIVYRVGMSAAGEQLLMTMGDGPPPRPLPSGLPAPAEVRKRERDELERFISELEMEARAAIREKAAIIAEMRRSRGRVFWSSLELDHRACNCMLILRARHVDPPRARRLVDAYRETEELERNWRATHDTPPFDYGTGSSRYAQVRRQIARVGAPVSLRYVGHRAGWTCAICQLVPVLQRPPRGSQPHPLGPSLDHIIPIALGGADVPENVRLTHDRCNRLRGDDYQEADRRRWRKLVKYDELALQVAVWERHCRDGRELDELGELLEVARQRRYRRSVQEWYRDRIAAEEIRLSGRAPGPGLSALPEWYQRIAQDGAALLARSPWRRPWRNWPSWEALSRPVRSRKSLAAVRYGGQPAVVARELAGAG